MCLCTDYLHVYIEQNHRATHVSLFVNEGSWTRCIPMLGSPQSNVSADYSKSLALIVSKVSCK